MSTTPAPSHQFHRRPAVLQRYGICCSTLYRWMDQGYFPQPVRLGPNTVAWREADLRAFEDQVTPQGGQG